MSPSTTCTQKVLQNRAIQCSFTSVFHISKTTTTAKGWKEAKEAENIFIKAVVLPMSFMGLLGFGSFVKRDYFT